MMFEVQQEWIALFKSKFPENAHPAADSRTIIDDFLKWCNNPVALVDIFECICIVFLKWISLNASAFCSLNTGCPSDFTSVNFQGTL
jgi:hypothetical protein